MNVYLARLRALNLKKCLPDQPSKPSKPGYEGFEGEPGMAFLKNQGPVCCQCGGGPATNPAYDAPTVPVKDGNASALVHPGWCYEFWKRAHHETTNSFS